MGRIDESYAAADDLAQEVCRAVLTTLPQLRDSGRPLLSYVYEIAAHEVSQATAAEARNGDTATRLRRMLETLSESQREVILLRMIVGLSTEETAEAVGMSASGVRLTQHLAMQRLRGSLGLE